MIGGFFGNKAAKHQWANADRYATEMQMAPFRLKEPFLRDVYSGAQGALNDALATGAYTGPTYAGMDAVAREGYDALANQARNAMGLGSGFMTAAGGFANNAADIYNRASGRTIDDAVDFATSSPQAQSMIEAAMRDSTRRLNEQTLPGIGLAASATNNANNSRRFMNEAFAQRAYDDRRADVASNVFRGLTNQYLSSESRDLSNMTNANNALSRIFGFGANMGRQAAGDLAKAGGAFQTDRQGQLDADRDLFDRQRDFAMGQFGAYNSILGNLPNVGQVRASTANPYTAALSGAMMGAGFGGNMYDYFNRNRQAPAQPTYNNSPYAINPIFEPAGF